MNPYAQSADTYLVQRVMSASPEQQAALLMEGAQRFLGKAIQAIEKKEHVEMGRCLSRATEIITESMLRLNYEDGGELVENLTKIYDWWTREIFEASNAKDTARLTMVSTHMGEIRQAWEQLHEKQVKSNSASNPQVGDQVV